MFMAKEYFFITILFLSFSLVACGAFNKGSEERSTELQQVHQPIKPDIDVLEKWERLKKDPEQQKIKQQCNCENDPWVLKEDGETTYYYRLAQCRSECNIK